MESKNLYTIAATIRLRKGQGRILKAGGAQVYGNRIDTTAGGYENGDLAAVKDFDGYGLGHGFISTNSELIVRILSHEKDTIIDQNFIKMRVKNVWEYRKATTDIPSYRILFGGTDFLPGIVISKLSDVLVVESLTLGIDRLKPITVEMLKKVPTGGGVIIRGTYGHSDAKVRLQEGMERYKGFVGEPFDAKVGILENGVHYLIDVEDGRKTGSFLDQKYNRLAVQNLYRRVQPDKMLDYFTHTSSFTLSTGLAGSKDVLGVDAPRLAVNQVSENVTPNGIQGRVHFECVDVFNLLPKLEQDGQKFDVVILDPPVFTRSRNSIENTAKGYREISLRSTKLVKDEGYLVACSCFHFIDPEFFTGTTREAAGNVYRRLRQIEYHIQANDHPILWAVDESYYPKFYIFQVCNGGQEMPRLHAQAG